jgi:chromate transporter
MAEAAEPVNAEVASAGPTTASLFFEFLKLGAVAFGGPAMVAYIGKLAARRGWVAPEEYAEGVALCQSIPGATAMQTAAWVGLRVGRVRGALAAFAGFGLPAGLLMVTTSAFYDRANSLGLVQVVFEGLRATIVALVANAAFEFGRKSVRSWMGAFLALACTAALYFRANPVLVIAAAVGLWLVVDRKKEPEKTARVGRPMARTTSLAAGILVGAAAVVAGLFMAAPRLGELALLCMKVDVLAFGGGFASVPLLFHEMVEARSWVDARTFMDGIALGQVTPGPIVVTATFIGYRVAGLVGALVATISIFLPSFVLVVALAPLFTRLQARPWFGAAVRGASLSFVGLLVFVCIQLATSVHWSVGSATIAVLGLVALRAGLAVPWVVLASATAAAFVR